MKTNTHRLLIVLFIGNIFQVNNFALSQEITDSSLKPGNKIKDASIGEWKLALYEGMVIAFSTKTNITDTVFVSTEDTTWEVTDNDTTVCTGTSDYRVLSIIDNIISYEYSYNSDCGAHPSYGAMYRTIELGNRNDDGVPLSLLFSEEQILNAFSKDSILMRYSTNKHPKSLPEFISSLDGGCDVSFYHFLGSWCIRAITKTTAIIDFLLPHGCEANRGMTTNLTIELQIPADKKDIFEYGDKNKLFATQIRKHRN